MSMSLGNKINIGHFVIDDLHLEGVEQLGLSDVPDTDLSLLPGGDEKVMLIGVNQSRGPGVVRTETSNINNKFSLVLTVYIFLKGKPPVGYL